MKRDKIQSLTASHVIGKYSVGIIHSHFYCVDDARDFMDLYPALARDNWAIYTQEEWEREAPLRRICVTEKENTRHRYPTMGEVYLYTPIGVVSVCPATGAWVSDPEDYVILGDMKVI